MVAAVVVMCEHICGLQRGRAQVRFCDEFSATSLSTGKALLSSGYILHGVGHVLMYDCCGTLLYLLESEPLVW